MIKMFKTIYYIYDTYVYTGFIRQIHGAGYSKEHALGVFTFLQFCNLISLCNFSNLSWFLKLPILYGFSFAIVLYFINRYFLIHKNFEKKPSTLMITIAMIYVVGSLVIFCLSFLYAITK